MTEEEHYNNIDEEYDDDDDEEDMNVEETVKMLHLFPSNEAKYTGTITPCIGSDGSTTFTVCVPIKGQTAPFTREGFVTRNDAFVCLRDTNLINFCVIRNVVHDLGGPTLTMELGDIDDTVLRFNREDQDLIDAYVWTKWCSDVITMQGDEVIRYRDLIKARIARRNHSAMSQVALNFMARLMQTNDDEGVQTNVY